MDFQTRFFPQIDSLTNRMKPLKCFKGLRDVDEKEMGKRKTRNFGDELS
jgi:hypothetical protein